MFHKISLIFFILFTVNLASAETVSLNVAYDTTPNPPFNYGDHLLKKPGSTLDALRVVAKKLELKLIYHPRPWKRCLHSIKRNEVDLVIGASYNKKRHQYAHYPMLNGKVDLSRSYNSQSYVIYKFKDFPFKWKGKKLSDLKDFRIAATLGYSITNDLKKAGVHRIDETSGSRRNLSLLLNKRVQLLIDLPSSVDSLIKKEPELYKNIIKVHPVVVHKEHYLLLSKAFVHKNPELSEKLWSEFAKYSKTKEYLDNLQSYLKE